MTNGNKLLKILDEIMMKNQGFTVLLYIFIYYCTLHTIINK